MANLLLSSVVRARAELQIDSFAETSATFVGSNSVTAHGHVTTVDDDSRWTAEVA